MASITDIIFDLSNLVPYVNIPVTAYLASDQTGGLYHPDGSTIRPLGTPQGMTSTDRTGVFTISGLTQGVLYNLWVAPTDGRESFWIANKLPDLEESPPTKCILYGTIDDPREIDIIWAFLEVPCIVSSGLHINQGVVLSTPSISGFFSLPLWPTEELTPPSLYRLNLGKSVYRGSVPSDLVSISLKDWLALSSTQVLA